MSTPSECYQVPPAALPSESESDCTNEILPATSFQYYGCSVLKSAHPSTKALSKKKDQSSGSHDLELFIESKKHRPPRKYEIYIVYNTNKCNKMRVRKVKFGTYGDIVREESTTAEDVAKMRDKYGKLLIDSSTFSDEIFRYTGAFFNPKFWEINTQWCSTDGTSMNETIAYLDALLTDKYRPKI